MNQAQYAKLSGLTAGRVCQLVKAGMPLTSKEAADQWRGMGARAREAQQKKGKKASAPIQSDSGPYRPPEAQDRIPNAEETADTPLGAYERQRRIEQDAFRLAQQSLNAGRPDAGKLVAIHAQAARNLTLARQEVLTLSEQERTLVAGEWVRKIMGEHDGAVIALAKAMPKMLSGRIAPHDPDHAEQELSRWVEDVFLKTLHQTDPWKA
jgi:hypothetical protein